MKPLKTLYDLPLEIICSFLPIDFQKITHWSKRFLNIDKDKIARNMLVEYSFKVPKNFGYWNYTQGISKLIVSEKNFQKDILYAVLENLSEVVKLLLVDSRLNPNTDNNRALKFAHINGHIDVLELLMKDPICRNYWHDV